MNKIERLTLEIEVLREEAAGIELLLAHATEDERRTMRAHIQELRGTMVTKRWQKNELELRESRLLPVRLPIEQQQGGQAG